MIIEREVRRFSHQMPRSNESLFKAVDVTGVFNDSQRMFRMRADFMDLGMFLRDRKY